MSESLAPAGLDSQEVLRFGSVIVVGMTLMLTAAASFILERRHNQRPMFALTLMLIAWCTLMLGTATSGVGRMFPFMLVVTPLLSGFTGPALFIHTRQLTSPGRPASLHWLWLGFFGTSYSILSLTIPEGLTYATEAIVHHRPFWHPLLSPFMAIQSFQLASFTVISTFLVTRAFWTKSRPDLRQSQFWLLVTCWTCLGIVVLTNILPSFKILLTEIEPALVTLPIAIVGCLSVRTLGRELQLVQTAQDIARASRMESLGTMARGLAHDLNNILAAIIGHAEITKMKFSQKQPADENLYQIIESSQRAAELLNRMMTFSGRYDDIAEPIDPRAPIEAAFQSIQPLQETSRKMRLQLAKDLPKVCIEPSELSSAVDNLLSNALQALEKEAGQVTLRASVEVAPKIPPGAIGELAPGGSALRIEVEDTGRGMTAGEASRALEPFYSSRPDGKGLGLVGVLSTVKGAGGSLWFSSQRGTGTRFVIWLPVVKPTPNITSNSAPISLKQALIVEDEPEVSRVLTQMVRSLGVEVISCSSGEEALALYEKLPALSFEMALIDIRLVNMDGIELSHRLLNDHGVSTVLLISGDEPGPRIAQFDSRPVVFCRKPLTLEQLEQAFIELRLQPVR